MVPEGVYRYGEAGIGTCLAGPADLQFFEHEGGTFLAVVNADPFAEFRAGSVLVVDWDDLQGRLGVEERIPVDEVEAVAAEIVDDDDGDGEGGNAFLGGFGYLPTSQTAIVTSRLTEGSVVRAGRDEAFFLDLKDLQRGRIDVLPDTMLLEDDPMPVVVDADAERVYVGNLTDHSVSVLTTDVAADSAFPVEKVDVATGAGATDAILDDADASGTVAEVTRLVIPDADLVVEDRWTLTFVDATTRLFVPTLDEDDGSVGLVRFSSGDTLTFDGTAFGPEEVDGAGEVLDPFVEHSTDGSPVLWYAHSDGTIGRALATSVEAGEWEEEVESLLLGGFHGGPSVAPLPGEIGLYTDVRDAPGGDASISLATSVDGIEFAGDEIVLEAPAGTSFEDPFAVLDAGVSKYRMWLTVRSGGNTTIALSESDDGRQDWSPPEPVFDASLQVGAPVVAVLDGRYAMWMALSDGTRWDHAFSWSYDGRRWTDPVVVVEGQVAFDPAVPTRAGLQTDPIGAWRIEGVDQGPLPSLLPAGATEPTELFGYEISIASGHEIEDDVVPDRRAEGGVVPGSVVPMGALDVLYATAIGAGGRERVVVLTPSGDEWVTRVGPDAMDAMLGVGPAEAASSPVVVEDPAGGYVMFVSIADADGARIRRSTSADGFVWTEAGDRVVREDADVSWDSASQFAHSLEVLPDGRLRLWYEGSDGSRTRIGAATADDLSSTFARDPGAGTDWQLGTGAPGGFDDTAVADPLAVVIGDTTHLYYSGFDGATWRIGHAEIGPDGEVLPRTDATTNLSIPAMNPTARTFSAAGVAVPVLRSLAGDRLELFYTGFDGDAWRTGLASSDTDAPDMVFAEQRFPTAGDTISYETTRGGEGVEVVELGQTTQWYSVTGHGMSSLVPDPDRGFLYVTTKVDAIGGGADNVYVVDVRDDSDGTFHDANYLDLEGIVRVDTGSANAGYRDGVVSRTRGLLYLTMRNPDGLVIVDVTRIVDDDTKAPTDAAAVAILPLQSSDDDDDEGADTFTAIGGAGMALSADERFLLVTHFRSNALSVFDLEAGAWGEEVAWITNVGENPHVVRISPDGRWAAIANYQGDVDGGTVSATLAFVDLDPASERYLEVVSWLVNVP